MTDELVDIDKIPDKVIAECDPEIEWIDEATLIVSYRHNGTVYSEQYSLDNTMKSMADNS